MNTETLRYFATVYELRSVPKAAEAIHISTQGLGKAIRQMERQCGAELFDKQNGQLLPTPLAHRIYEEVQVMLRAESNVQAMIDDYLSKSRIRFAVPSQYQIGYQVEKYVNQYNQTYGAAIQCVPLSYTASPREQDEMLLSGECDYRILNGMFNQLEGFDVAPLCSISFFPVTNRRSSLLGKPSLCWADLRDQTILVENPEYPYVRQVVATCRANGFEPKLQVAEGDLFLLKIIRAHRDVVYFTKHPSIIGRVEGEDPEIVVLDLRPAVKSNFIIQGRKEKWSRHLVQYLQNALKAEESLGDMGSL